MDELLSEFLTETSESLATLDLELVKLEQEPNNPSLIDNIFRLVHTIKGTCGFLGLPRLEAVAHSSENVLGKVRDHELEVTPQAVSLILSSLDRIKDLLATLEETEAEPDGDDGDLITQLDAMAAGELAPVAEAAEPEAPAEPDIEVAELQRELKPGEVSLEELERVFQETEVEEAAPSPVESTPAAVAPKPAASAQETAPKAAEAAGKDKSGESSVANQSIRVSVDLLENLMTMVSELVLTRNQLLQMVRGHADSEFKVPLQRLCHVTTELQEGVMKTRMQPIGNAWAKLPRIVRDLSLEVDKKIDLQMLGSDTELDRQVLELIKDPLTHMVRNSADHGLEIPADRLAAGKPEVGKIVLNAYHEGGHIIIEIKDDGRGIDVARLRQKMLDTGIASEAELEEMSDQQIQKQIFAAGFSTAEKVTAVSGRGVGMDVVRTNIEKIGGTIDLKSVWGRGSTFTIKIPLTLAIVSALIVECCSDRFAIPQLSVVELVRASKESEHRIEMINETPVLRLRNRLLPLVYLGDCLNLADAENHKLTEGAEVFVVVTQVGTYTFGIVVDRVFDTEEIVVKPVAPILREISMFSGNTILGDGSVIMILDPNGIAASTNDVSVGESAGAAEERVQASAAADTTSILVFRAGNEQPKGVPLSLVARLEEIDVDSVEKSNGQLVVQYRGKLMPLVKMSDDYDLRETGRQPILVFADGEHSMGLVVDEIVDIIEDRMDIELSSARKGYLGSAVIDGKATDMIDVGHFLTKAFSDWFGLNETGAFGHAQARKLLLVDDSPFFRNMLTPLLEVAGYQVTVAGDADEALALRESGAAFDCIISDIEMPGMSGFELAEQLKSDGLWQQTPIVALTSHVDPEDFERGRKVGFSDYVGKFDRDALLTTLSETLAEKANVA
ncbi:MAG: chemotaxis protein CheW [Alphaproteobacteria bacterium]|nr:chemotaxis protein CheW [Alphaproteobacteria bacterium]